MVHWSQICAKIQGELVLKFSLLKRTVVWAKVFGSAAISIMGQHSYQNRYLSSKIDGPWRYCYAERMSCETNVADSAKMLAQPTFAKLCPTLWLWSSTWEKRSKGNTKIGGKLGNSHTIALSPIFTSNQTQVSTILGQNHGLYLQRPNLAKGLLFGRMINIYPLKNMPRCIRGLDLMGF